MKTIPPSPVSDPGPEVDTNCRKATEIAAPTGPSAAEGAGYRPARHWSRSIPFVAAWFGADARDGATAGTDDIDWIRATPFLMVHAMLLGVFWVGWSPVAVTTAVLLYFFRIFAITAFYHRYFAHRAFKTGRAIQFLFAIAGASAAQRGPLWWAAHHRHHHAHSDRPGDAHSPAYKGFWWSHVGWFLSHRHLTPDYGRVRDLARYPELRWLDRVDVLVPVALATALYILGGYLEAHHPELGTSAAQMLVWGFFVSTVAVYHATYTVNSLCHVFGRRRYDTPDNSRNSLLLALLTLGEGWHNNHHHYPAAARQGFFWWEIDLTYYVLRVMAACGIIRELKPVPAPIRDARARRLRFPGGPRRADGNGVTQITVSHPAKVAQS